MNLKPPALFTSLLLASPASATLVASSLSYVAADHDNDFSWEASVGTGFSQMALNNVGGAPVSATVGGTNFSGVNAWFNSPNFSHPSIQASQGNVVTQTDATFEFILRPVNFTGNHIIFDTGGNGDGTTLVLLGNTLEFRFQDANSGANRVILSHTFSPGDESKFHHIIGTVDVETASTGTGALYVNGNLTSGPMTSSDFINDWDGGDPGSIGGSNTNIPGGAPAGNTLFDGDFATFNFYSGTAFDQSNVDSHFNAIPEPSSALLLIAGFAGLGLRRKR